MKITVLLMTKCALTHITSLSLIMLQDIHSAIKDTITLLMMFSDDILLKQMAILNIHIKNFIYE